LDHPNILRLFEIFSDEKRYFLVTELCSGKDLFQLISEKGRLNETTTAIIMKKILEAVVYIHSK